MALYKRGNVWWFKFRFEGQVIRESANTNSKSLARDAERARRRGLETAVNRIQKRERMPLFIVSIDSGLRASEVRSLRHKDLKLSWTNGVISKGEIIVPKSKTEAGTGRLVPLTNRACGALTIWLSRFPDAQPDSYVFPK